MAGMDPLKETALREFGIPYLFPWQRLVIANILDAVDAEQRLRAGKISPDDPDGEVFDEDGVHRGRQIVLLPTGAGKSLCFQLPALHLAGPTLVIYPLLALMGDQLRRLYGTAVDPAIFRGGQTPAERDAQFRRLEGTDGKQPARLIIANPEILSAGSSVLSRISARKVSHIAIDEAHCVSEWGDSFRPAYLELGTIIDTIQAPAVTAFTATASPPVLSRIADVLFSGAAHLVRGDSDRPNIRYRVRHCRAKYPALAMEASTRNRPMVVFCATRGGTERTARYLREVLRDTDIRFYHAGLLREEKADVESWFHGHERAILCTTCAWGMGVDKKDVRTVIHRDAPPTAEAYIQEAGRGGRDGSDAEAVLLWSPEDRARIERKPEREKNRALVLARFAESVTCRREVLLEALGDPKAGADAPEGERIACSGCDVCDGTARNVPGDAELVHSWIARNPRCYTPRQAATRLTEAGNRYARELYGRNIWNNSDFTDCIREMEKAGELARSQFFPCRGRLMVPGGTILPRLQALHGLLRRFLQRVSALLCF